MHRFGLVQMDIVWENIGENKKKVERFLKEAKEKAVECIVFPEMTMTGFSMNTSMAAYYDEINEFFEKKAVEYGVTIVYGIIAEGGKEKFENRLIIVDETGKRLMEYAKIHPFSFGAESKYYTGGEQVYACHWKDTILSGFICYDLRFPTIFQMVSKESKVIFVIANWPDARVDQWDALLCARAVENACYVIGVNRTGRAGSLNYNGHAGAYNFNGERLTEIIEEEAMLTVDLDLSLIDQFRAGFPVIQDRRSDLYKKMKLIIHE
ncbi:MAG: nitrilase-related carbon-nitrogen hydrolase [Eubacteriales bacterium]|nr:nitrilase-related carbon-nitrogen hydrolase [Eubacteriales bacterium]